MRSDTVTVAGGGTCSVMERPWVSSEVLLPVSGSKIRRSSEYHRSQFWTLIRSVADSVRGTSALTRTVGVRSRSLKMSAWYQWISKLWLAGTQAWRSHAVMACWAGPGLVAVPSACVVVIPPATKLSRIPCALAHVGHPTQPDKALPLAPSATYPPAWYSPRADKVMPPGRRIVEFIPRISVGCCGPRTVKPLTVQRWMSPVGRVSPAALITYIGPPWTHAVSGVATWSLFLI